MTTGSLLKLLKGLGACLFTATLAAIPACGPGELGEEGASDVGQEESADLGEENAQADVQEGEDVAEAEQAETTCALEYVEPCIAFAATCAVRCCDDTLHKSPQFCGNCGVWATGACTYHGGRKRIRWE